MNLSKLDPDTVLLLGTLIASGVTWLINKARGVKQVSAKDALWGALRGVVVKLAESDHTAAVLREKLTKAAHEALERLSIKRSTVVDVLVATLVERGISEVRELVLERKKREAELAAANAKLQAAVASLADKAPGVLDAFTAKGTFPKMEKLGEVLVICKEPGCNQPAGHEDTTPHGMVNGTVEVEAVAP